MRADGDQSAFHQVGLSVSKLLTTKVATHLQESSGAIRRVICLVLYHQAASLTRLVSSSVVIPFSWLSVDERRAGRASATSSGYDSAMETDPGRSSTSVHHSELGHWERAWQRPTGALRSLVDDYHGFRQQLAVPATHRGVPSAVLPLVFNFGPAQTITPSHRHSAAVTVGSFLSGLHDEYVLINADGFHGIQVDLRPVAGFRLLGRPLREFTGQTVPLDAVFGRDAERLLDDLACAPDWPSRFRRLDHELVRRLATGVPPDPEVEHAWRCIVTSRGRCSVTSIAEAVGWSPRRLRARCGVQLGLSPKRLALLTRFEHAAQLLGEPNPPELAEVALSAGYYDQAHLTNEVRAFSGLTPRQLVAGHLPDAGGVFDLADR